MSSARTAPTTLDMITALEDMARREMQNAENVGALSLVGKDHLKKASALLYAAQRLTERYKRALEWAVSEEPLCAKCEREVSTEDCPTCDARLCADCVCPRCPDFGGDERYYGEEA